MFLGLFHSLFYEEDVAWKTYPACDSVLSASLVSLPQSGAFIIENRSRMVPLL